MAPRKNLRYLFSLVGIVMAASLILPACSSGPEVIAVGEKAPDFSLPTSSGGEVSLSDYKGSKPVLLFFHMAVG